MSQVDSTGAVLKSYANAVTYWEHGPIKSMTRGDNLQESWSYDATRLQPTGISVGTAAAPRSVLGLDLYYCAGKNPANPAGCKTNNGNLITATLGWISADQNYGYDYGFNRLTSASETYGTNPTTSWSRGFGYDSYANGWTTGSNLDASTPIAASNFDAQNRLNINAAAYDGSGNPKTIAGYTLVWDAESRMVSSAIGGATTSYLYDGDGRRVVKQTGSATTVYAYDAMSNLAVEYGQGSVAASPCATCFVSVDQLGSARALTDGSGVVKERHDYLPFGEEIYAGVGGRTVAQGYLSSPSAEMLKVGFTSKERDAETGLDYFGARYMSSAQGRFTSVDPKQFSMRTIANPQKWNKYAYTLNNPLALVDPDGKEEVTITYRAFIPSASVTVFGKTNGGDARGFSTAAPARSRTSISIRLETDPSIRPGNPIISVDSHADPSTTIEGGRVVDTRTATNGLPFATGMRDANGTPIVNIQQDTKNPLSPGPQALTPGISANLNVMVYQDASTTQVTGTAAQFPASELNVTRQDGTTTPVIQFMPPTGATPFSLLRPDRTVNERRQTPACRSGDAGCTQ